MTDFMTGVKDTSCLGYADVYDSVRKSKMKYMKGICELAGRPTRGLSGQMPASAWGTLDRGFLP